MDCVVKSSRNPFGAKNSFFMLCSFLVMIKGTLATCSEASTPLPIKIPQGQDCQFKSILTDEDWIWRMRVTEFFMTTSMTEEEVLQKIRGEFKSEEALHLASFIEESKRGICRYRYNREEYFEEAQ